MRRSRRWRASPTRTGVARRLRQGPGRPAPRPGGRSRHARRRLRIGLHRQLLLDAGLHRRLRSPSATIRRSTSAPASSASTRCRSRTRSPCAGKARSTSPRPATYRFSMDVTGVGRLFVNEQTLIDVNANERSVLGEGTIELTAGQPAHIVVENVPFDLNLGNFDVHFSHIRLGAQTPATATRSPRPPRRPRTPTSPSSSPATSRPKAATAHPWRCPASRTRSSTPSPTRTRTPSSCSTPAARCTMPWLTRSAASSRSGTPARSTAPRSPRCSSAT